jgi:hypothetical protein
VSATVRASLTLLIGVALTGALIFAAHVQWPGYFGVVRLHMVLGALLALAGGLALAEHLRNTGSGAWSTAICIVAGGLLAVPTPYTLVLPEEAHDLGPLGWFGEALRRLLAGDGGAAFPVVAGLCLGALLLGSAGLTVVGLVSRVRERAASRRTGLGLTAVVAWATVSGLLLLLESITTLRPAQVLHAFAGSWALALLGVHVFARRAALARMPRWAVAVLGGLGLVGFAGLLVAKEAASNRAEDAPVYAMPQAALERDDAAAHARFDRSLLEGSLSCGASGCHEQITASWAGSAHRWSARNTYYRRAVEQLLWKDRWEDAVICAGCHDPAVALAGGLTEAYGAGRPPEDSEGVSCLACHRAVSIDRDPPANGAFSVALVPPYPGDPVAGVRLDARAHQRPFVMARPIYSSLLCESCHRVALAHDLVLQDATLSSNDDGKVHCRTCHLRPRGRVTYSHAMAGIDADLAAYADASPEEAESLAYAAEGVREFARLVVPVPLAEAPIAGGFLGLTLRLDGRDPLAVVATTTNERVGHAFPAGPLDLHQVWLEIAAVDAAGRTWLHEGALVDGRIDGEPRRLGGREVNAAGEEIEHHDVLSVVQVLDKRVLESGESLRDRFVLDGIEPAWPLTVRARWMFRRANPDFARWAGAEVPAWQVASAELVIEAP